MNPLYHKFIGKIALLLERINFILSIVFKFMMRIIILGIEEYVMSIIYIFPMHTQHYLAQSISNFILKSCFYNLLLLVESFIYVIIFLAFYSKNFDMATLNLCIWTFFLLYPITYRKKLTCYIELNLYYFRFLNWFERLK
jgi:hypothetical protein